MDKTLTGFLPDCKAKHPTIVEYAKASNPGIFVETGTRLKAAVSAVLRNTPRGHFRMKGGA